MTEPVFLALAEVMEIHGEMMSRYGGDSGVRDLGLLESAIAMPQASYGGTFLHATVFEMAGAYAYHIAENQPFVDGNKRTALGAALTFLKINGIDVPDPSGELFQAMIRLGTRRLSKSELGVLLQRLSNPRREK